MTDELTRLKAENAAMREALERIANGNFSDCQFANVGIDSRMRGIARAALSTPPAEAQTKPLPKVGGGPNSEAWFPWSPERGRPALFESDRIRTRARRGTYSNDITVSADCWGERGEWTVVEIGAHLKDRETIQRLASLTGYDIPPAEAPMRGESITPKAAVAWLREQSSRDLGSWSDGVQFDRIAETIIALQAALKDCADDLAERIEEDYRGTLHYPDYARSYERDMAPVRAARALLDSPSSLSNPEGKTSTKGDQT